MQIDIEINPLPVILWKFQIQSIVFLPICFENSTYSIGYNQNIGIFIYDISTMV